MNLNKTLRSLVLAASLLLVPGALVATTPPANADQLTEATPKVKGLMKKYGVQEVSFEEIRAAVGNGLRSQAKATIIDARPYKQYAQDHIPTAIPIPDTKFEEYFAKAEIPKDKKIIVYCGGYFCAKSPKVAGMLIAKGYDKDMIKVYNGGLPEWSRHSYKEITLQTAQSLFAKQAKEPVVFYDARPWKKFSTSTIPGSAFLPDTMLDKFQARFPTRTDTRIVVFCGGYECHKSHIVANRLVMMGYTNVYNYSGGVPEWKKAGLAMTGGGKKAAPEMAADSAQTHALVKVTPGEEGMVDGKWFKSIVTNPPKGVTIIDIRSQAEWDGGHVKGAMHLDREHMDPDLFLSKLPTGGAIVFYCGTGGRAYEAWDFLQEKKHPMAKDAFYFEGLISCDTNNVCKIEPAEPL